MKIYVIGDVHGNRKWEEVKALKKPEDHVVFLGDYVDWRGVNEEDRTDPVFEELSNLENICDWAVTDPNVHLLIGNHDIQYGSWIVWEYTGDYCQAAAKSFKRIYDRYSSLFKICWVYDKHLFSHAGIDKKFATTVQEVEDKWNSKASIRKNEFGASNESLSPLWIREKLTDPIDGYEQFVGHTPLPLIKWTELTHICKTYEDQDGFVGIGKGANGVWYCDTYSTDYVCLDVPSKDKRWVMTRANSLVKQGINRSAALRQAWRESKE